MKFAIVEEILKGGLADGKVISDFDEEQVKMGRKVEREHTDDSAKIDEIVMDHLTEDPKYYTKLKKVEEGAMDYIYAPSDKFKTEVKALVSRYIEVRDDTDAYAVPDWKDTQYQMILEKLTKLVEKL